MVDYRLFHEEVRVVDDFDVIRYIYDSDRYIDDSDKHIREHVPMYDAVHRAVHHILQNYLPVGGCVLDFGGGTGQLLRSNAELFIDRKITTYCVDNSRAAREAYQMTADKLMLGDNITLYESLDQLGDVCTLHGKFDAVISVLTLSLIPVRRREEIISRLIKGVAYNGGVVAIVDKIMSRGGYAGEVLGRMEMIDALKCSSTSYDRLRRNIDMFGKQIPINASIFNQWTKFFQFGAYCGWFNEH